MDKIAIYTIQTNNYGNRLQNYAVSKICERLGYRAINVANDIASIGKVFPHFYLFIKKVKNRLRRVYKRDLINSFNKFNEFLNYSADYISKDGFKITGDYTAIVVGSDQVWNTSFEWLSINAFLPFHHPHKISFAASFGLDAIPYDKEIAECLNDFDALSVREEAGAKIIKNLIGRDAAVLVDPTMLLTREEWMEVSKRPTGAVESGYILTYFLSPKCDAAKKVLEETKDGREIYEILNPADKITQLAGPSEFLWLFDHADLILTDSFHACVFSFLFDKPFIVYDRNWNEGNMNSRLETFLSKFYLERKYANSGLQNDIWEHDYAQGHEQLDLEKKKALDFLREALTD